MAEVVVDSVVMREKANRIKNDAERIRTLYDEMRREVETMASKMSGTAIETARDRFVGMQQAFETFSQDIKSYSDFLNAAATDYERVHDNATQKASEQGKIF